MEWKTKFLIIGIAFILVIGFGFFLVDKEVISIEGFGQQTLEPRMEKSENFWENVTVSIRNNTIVFQRFQHQVNITPFAIINGNRYDIAQYLRCGKHQEEWGWKWECNITIPDTPLGQQIANNLEEINFDIQSTIDLRRIRNRGFGFEYYLDTQPVNQFYNHIRYVAFSFSDIVNKANWANVTRSLQVRNKKDVTVVFDVREITFHRGQTIKLDPSISINVAPTTTAVLLNISFQDMFNFTQLTIGSSDIGFINDSNVAVNYLFDVNKTFNSMPPEIEFHRSAHDYSKHQISVDNTGNVRWVDDGIIGGALEFDGNGDYLQNSVPPQNLNLTHNFTISAWIFHKQSQLAGVVRMGFPGSTSSTSQNYRLRTFTNGRIDWSVSDRSTEINARTGNVAALNQWVHIVGLLNDTDISVYVDGVFQAKTSRTINPVSASGDDFFIGTRITSLGFFNGTIDDVLILNTSLSGDQILSLYQNQSSRFFPTGSQTFNNINFSLGGNGNENRANITVNITEFFGSMINVSIGNNTGSDYDYGNEFAFTNNFLSNLTIGTPQNMSIRFIFHAGNASDNSFITPSLENIIKIDSWNVSEAVPFSCAIDCTTNPTISTNEQCENKPLNFTGSGVATITGNITNWSVLEVIDCFVKDHSGRLFKIWMIFNSYVGNIWGLL